MEFSQKISLLRDVAGYLLQSRTARRRAVKPGGRKKMLVIRLDRLGDYALYLPYAAALRRYRAREEYEITLLGRPLWMPLARRQLDFDQFREMEPSRFLSDARYRRSLLAELAAEAFDIVIQPRFYREALVEDLLALAANAPESAAFSSSEVHLQRPLMRITERIYTGMLDSRTLTGSHELTRNRMFLEFAVPEFRELENPWRKAFPRPGALPFAGPYAVFLPGSGKSEKLCWQPEHFGELARQVSAMGLPVVACGTADEFFLAERLCSSCGGGVNLAGKQPIEEFVATVSGASLVVGNDTGGIHIAAMSGVPALAVAGQGQPGTFLPYPEPVSVPGVRPPAVVSGECRYAGCNWNCRLAEQGRLFGCIREIPLERAAAALADLAGQIPTGIEITRKT